MRKISVFLLLITQFWYIFASNNTCETNITTNGTTNGSNSTSTTLNDTETKIELPCDIETDGAVCLGKGEKVLTSEAKPQQIIGHWKFDEKDMIIDSSGNELHVKGKPGSGSAYAGKGYSVYFNGSKYVRIPHKSDFLTRTYTVSFWVFMLKPTEDPNSASTSQKGMGQLKENRLCPLLQKGADNKTENIFQRAPAIFYDRKERNLKVSISTSDVVETTGESLNSISKLPYMRWTHIAVVRGEKKTMLFVNGILDAINSTAGWTAPNSGPLFLGNTPWSIDRCKVPFYMDELRFYGRELKDFEIEAEASSSLGGVEPSFLHFGCAKCPVDHAAKSCQDGYHLCTSAELHTGAYQVARALGWWNSNLWSYSALKFVKPGSRSESFEETGIGICCSDLKS